jgi:hypothetical protein
LVKKLRGKGNGVDTWSNIAEVAESDKGYNARMGKAATMRLQAKERVLMHKVHAADIARKQQRLEARVADVQTRAATASALKRLQTGIERELVDVRDTQASICTRLDELCATLSANNALPPSESPVIRSRRSSNCKPSPLVSPIMSHVPKPAGAPPPPPMPAGFSIPAVAPMLSDLGSPAPSSVDLDFGAPSDLADAADAAREKPHKPPVRMTPGRSAQLFL